MLKDHSSSAILAATDMDRSRKFYGTVLGLELVGDMGGDVLTYRTGSTNLVVYRSAFAGTNKANAVVWGVGDDIDTIVSKLRDNGVRFERYDAIGGTFDDGIHRVSGMRLVWLKDPDGNILHINDI